MDGTPKANRRRKPPGERVSPRSLRRRFDECQSPYFFSSFFSSAGLPSESTLSSAASASAALSATAGSGIGPPGERDGFLQDGILTVDHDLNGVTGLVGLYDGKHFFRIGDRLAVH